MKLKVAKVDRVMVNVPFRDRVRPWNELLVGQFGVVEIVRVESTTGHVGYGETLIHYTWQTVSEQAVVRTVGADAVGLLADDSLGAGLQMALYDLVGHALEVPMWKLLGQPMVRDRVPISWWNTKMPAKLLAAEAEDALREGYRAHKIKARPWFDVREQVAAIAAVTPESYAIDIDWNGMLRTPGEAVPVLRELDREPRTGLYESPVKQTDIAGMAEVRSQVARPVVEHYIATRFPDWIRADGVDGFVVCLAGPPGIIAQGLQCAVFNKEFFLQIVGTGLTTAYTIHLGAVLTHARMPSVTCLNVYADDLLVHPLAISDGFAEVPTAPGLGIEVDLDAIERYRMDAPYLNVFPRKLLTVQFGDGRRRCYSDIHQLWRDCREAGALPVQDRGATLDLETDDGSGDFDTRYRAAQTWPYWL
ncbi:hypothetical protein GCM10009804_70780 [Kribbella hippodromi]|uniref:Mandelate racemase/muconate lactonizing enzyme C-terminal domain-containing protein n=1 Tax=Kribbella hippodromi TaxID=434347 RepID=A0ABN2EDI5_9ACTN